MHKKLLQKKEVPHMQSQDLILLETGQTIPEAANTVTLRPRHQAPSAMRSLLIRRKAWVAQHKESGMATAEYAIAMIAAAGFAGLLIVILKSGPVRDMLTSIVETALGTR